MHPKLFSVIHGQPLSSRFWCMRVFIALTFGRFPAPEFIHPFFVLSILHAWQGHKPWPEAVDESRLCDPRPPEAGYLIGPPPSCWHIKQDPICRRQDSVRRVVIFPAEQHVDAAAEDVEPGLLLLHHQQALPPNARSTRPFGSWEDAGSSHGG